MTIAGDLESLINSMSKSEKRHFSVYASRHVIGSKNVYMRLFEHIAAEKKHDVESIQKAFVGESFLEWLPSINKYLYTLVLKSLRVYRSNKTVSLQVKELLEYVEILYERALYSQCIKTLFKAKKLANEYEMQLAVLDCLMWEYKIYSTSEDVKAIKSFNDKEHRDSLKKFSNLLDFQMINISMISHLRTEGHLSRDAGFSKKLDRIVKQKLLRSENSAVSFDAKNYFYSIYASYYRAKGDFINNHFYREKIVNLCNSNPAYIEENKIAYSSAMLNLINSKIELKKYDEAIRSIYKLRELQVESFNLSYKIFTYSYDMELGIYNATGNFEKAVKLVPYIGDKLKKEKRLSGIARLALNYEITVAYFGAANYKQALFWVNKLLNDRYEQRMDIYYFARIFSLIVHYEIGNKELLEYISRSSHRFLDKKERIYKFETLIFSFFKKNITNVRPENLTHELKKLRIALLNLEKDPQEKKIFEYFDFISWVESKIQNRSFADIVREKVK